MSVFCSSTCYGKVYRRFKKVIPAHPFDLSSSPNHHYGFFSLEKNVDIRWCQKHLTAKNIRLYGFKHRYEYFLHSIKKELNVTVVETVISQSIVGCLNHFGYISITN